MSETHNIPSHGWAKEVRGGVVTVVVAVLLALAAGWWSTQIALNDIRYRQETNEKNEQRDADNILQLSMASQATAIHTAEMTKDLQFFGEQLKEIRSEQEDIKRTLRR